MNLLKICKYVATESASLIGFNQFEKKGTLSHQQFENELTD
jgi:hypothetical protein